MADNSSIAFQIYKTIEEKQNELIKKNAIKPEDIQELSEENFIDELQTSVNFYAKNINNKSVISEIYKEILKQVDRISDISQISTASGIKLPEDIIREGVKLATERTRVEDSDNYFENDSNNDKLISQFYEIESLEEKMDFYKSLSDEEKETIRKDVYTDLFGKETADELLSQEKQASCENSGHYNELESSKQEDVRDIINANSIAKYIMKNLGINVDEMHLKLDMEEMGFVISRLKQSMDKHHRIDEKASKEVLNVLIRKMNFPDEKAREIITYFEEQYKENPEFYADTTEYKKHRQETMLAYKKYESIIQKFSQQLGISFDERLRETFFRSFDKNGKLNIDALIVNFELSQQDKESYYNYASKNSSEIQQFKYLKKDILRFFNFQYADTEHQDIVYARDFALNEDNTGVVQNIEGFKRIGENHEDDIISKKNPDTFSGMDRIDIDNNLLQDFSTNEMNKMLADTFGSEFYKSMMLQDEKDKEYSYEKKGFGKIKESKVDLFYGVEAEDLMLGEELSFYDKPKNTHFEDKPKEPKGIIAETIDFSVGMKSFVKDEDKTINSSATVSDIRRLIERQGNMKDILATIGKVSEIGKNGINSVEQEKNVDGEKTDDQKTSAPSDEEKE